ncbi:10 kda [Cystoisospora suis]|uniref:20 kDa chaperonin, chloroplastic n=1 Tax=Cystoisospora suis TaxID=483139 RepID=A0A2C6L861_9APIC|nr:10 kda [Cystoisospora suis]
MEGAVTRDNAIASRGTVTYAQSHRLTARDGSHFLVKPAILLLSATCLFFGLSSYEASSPNFKAALFHPVLASRTGPSLNGSLSTNSGMLPVDFSSAGSSLSTSHPSLAFIRGRAPSGTAMPSSIASTPSHISCSRQQSKQGECSAPVSSHPAGSNQSLKSTAKYSFEGEEIRGPLQPLRGMILLERRESPKTSSGGVYLPAENSKGKQLAKVLEVGPGEVNRDTNVRIPIDVSPGDWTIISRHVYDSFKYNGKDCVLVSASDILAKVSLTTEDRDANPADITPLGDNVLVKIVKQPERTASGLYLHQSARENSRGSLKRAEVISVGPGRYNKHGERLPIEIHRGDTVVFSSYSQDEPDMKYKDDIYAFVKAADLLGKW